MADKRTILIVEDDEDISMIEEAYLRSAGFETILVPDGSKVSETLAAHKADLILLDLMLPGKSGYDVCREIREQIDIPILMVSARTEAVDKVKGFGLGADDYITKPFDPAELVARIHANLRQHDRVMKKYEAEEARPKEICIGNIRILPESWKVFKGEKEIKFPNREFELLRFMAENPNIVFSKETLFEKIWGYDYVGG